MLLEAIAKGGVVAADRKELANEGGFDSPKMYQFSQKVSPNI
jgi:hypothetical protein